MKLSHKIYAGFCLLILLMTGLGAYSFVNTQTLSSYFTDYRTAARTNLIIGNLKADLLKGHVAGKEYIASKNPDDLEKFNRYMQKIIEMDDDIHTTVTDEEAHEKLDKIKDQVVQYRDQFIKEMQSTNADMAGLAAALDVIEDGYDDVSNKTVATQNKIGPEAQAIMDQGERVIAIASITSALVTLAIAFAIAGTTVRSLNNVTTIMSRLRSGDFTVEIKGQERKDEIGEMARAIQKFKEDSERAYLLKQMVQDMPVNVMTVDVKNDFKINYMNNTSMNTLNKLHQYLPVRPEDMMGKSFDMFHKNPDHQRRLVGDPKNLPHRARIKIGTETMDLLVSAIKNANDEYVGAMLTWSIVSHQVKLADDFKGSVGTMATQIGATADNLQKNAVILESAIEQLSASALEISKRVSDSVSIVSNATKEAEETRARMDKLSDAAEKISNVISLIRSIADKINMLSLNATIESARAGDAGKGFAVVASEVKSLADRTTSAIAEITQKVEDMQISTQESVKSVQQITEVVQNINHISTTIASAVEEQQAATREIARNISGSGDVGSTSVITMATQMTAVSSQLQSECDGFLDKIAKM
ncbi:MAG: methyl-accepting chemotaxis protein [Alphaproteobacteria bacterium]|nr:methyl-accepting chemotaxis protein [Alphaproteobacteria bacterium]